MKLHGFDRFTLWTMNALLLCAASGLWVIVMYIATQRGFPLVGW